MKNHSIKDFENCTTAVRIDNHSCRVYSPNAKPVVERAQPTKVTKIGKKYVTTQDGTQFRVPASGPAPYLEEHSQYSPDKFLFMSLEEAIEFEAIHRVSDAIRDLTKKLPDGWRHFENYPSVETLEQIKTLLKMATNTNK